ncbi:MAG: CpaF family protein, partial [Acidimicrobiales bacterium]
MSLSERLAAAGDGSGEAGRGRNGGAPAGGAQAGGGGEGRAGEGGEGRGRDRLGAASPGTEDLGRVSPGRVSPGRKVPEREVPGRVSSEREIPEREIPGRGSPGGKGTSEPARRRPQSGLGGWDQSKRIVRERVLAEVGPRLHGLAGPALEREVRAALDRILAREEVQISPLQRRRFVQEVVQDTLGYGPLEPLLADPSITEIMCNAYDDVWVEREGRLEATGVAFDTDGHYRQVIDKIVTAVGRRLDEGSPMVDARLPDGSRVNVVLPPVAIHGAVLTIRRFPADAYRVSDLIGFGSLTADLAVVLEACVRAKLNVLVSGGTGTGKTTMLNVLSSFIPDGERVVTIEDAAELQLQQPHVVNMESRPPNAEGTGEIRIRELVRNSLRMRPDRIIVGEVRGAEALDMLQAMNTGHEGSLTTVHANSPRDALSRLETMVLMAGYDLPVRAIREQVTAAFDLIVHLERLAGGQRTVAAVTELQGLEGDVILLQDVFLFRAEGPAPAGGAAAGAGGAAGAAGAAGA